MLNSTCSPLVCLSASKNGTRGATKKYARVILSKVSYLIDFRFYMNESHLFNLCPANYERIGLKHIYATKTDNCIIVFQEWHSEVCLASENTVNN